MSTFKLPSIQHVARAIRPSIAEIKRELHGIDRADPFMSYVLSRKLAHGLYSGDLSLSAALNACGRQKSRQGKISNAEVAKALWADAQHREVYCHPLRSRKYAIRHDLMITVNPGFYFVEDGLVKIFWLQPWKTFELNEEQLGVLATVIRDTFAVDDFEGAHLHMLDVSAQGAGARSVKIYDFPDLPTLSSMQMKRTFDRFASAYDEFIGERVPKARRPRPSAETEQLDIFDRP